MLKKTLTSFLNRKTQAVANERELMETTPTPANTPGIEITFEEAQALAQAARTRLGVSAVSVHPITGDVKASHNGRDWFDVATSDLITTAPATDNPTEEAEEDETGDYVENADGTVTSHGFTFPTLRAYHTARNTLPEDVTQLDDGRYVSHGFTFATLEDYYTARGL